MKRFVLHFVSNKGMLRGEASTSGSIKQELRLVAKSVCIYFCEINSTNTWSIKIVSIKKDEKYCMVILVTLKASVYS